MFRKLQTLTYKNGNVYIGNIYNYQPNGDGKLIYKNGGTYEGQFQNGLPNGFGKLIIDDNTYMIGQFQDGRLKYGKYVDQNTQILGYWHQNECENICAILQKDLQIGFYLGGQPVGSQIVCKQIDDNQIQVSMFLDNEQLDDTIHNLEGQISEIFNNLNERKLTLLYSVLQQHLCDKIKVASQILITSQDLEYVVQLNQKQQQTINTFEQMNQI